MLFTSPVLLQDVFQDVNGFLKTPFPPGKHTLHLLDSCKELKAVNFPGNSISTRGWVNPIKSERQMKEGGESGDVQAISKICPLPASLFQNLTHVYVLPRQKDYCCIYPMEKQDTLAVHHASQCSLTLSASYRTALMFLQYFYTPRHRAGL